MKLIICDNYDEVSKKAADIVAEQVNSKPESVLSFVKGTSPIGMYNELERMNKAGRVDFSKVCAFNLDEYYPISPEAKESYRYFMNENLFSKINIDINNTHILDGMCEDPDKECQDYEELIAKKGGIDLQILGVGQNGHVGFNEPSENLNLLTHLADLTQNAIITNAEFFDDISKVPTQALTMGMGTIIKARKIVLIACGAKKHEAVKALLSGMITTELPASMLNLHTDVTLICDREAYSNDRLGVDLGGTDIKFGVLNSDNELIYKDIIPTDTSSVDKLVSDIANKCKEISKKYIVSSIGLGTPGVFKNGCVTAANLPFKDTNLKELLKKATGMPVAVSNDGNCAALGEVTCGAGKNVKNLVMVSLGTGVGGGIIIDNKIYEGKGSAGELGHIVIEANGRDCPCGLKGCLEQYASARALSKAGEAAAKQNPDSLLGKLYAENGKMNGRIFFDAIDEGCDVAAKVLDEYAAYLAIGLESIYYALEPDLIVLAGGITNSGDALLNPLKSKLYHDIPITVSKLKSDAGVVGAALLI